MLNGSKQTSMSRSICLLMVALAMNTAATGIFSQAYGRKLPKPAPAAVNIPPVDTTAVTTATSQATAAHADLTAAQTALNGVTRKFQEAFNARADVVAATNAVTASKSAYDDAASPVLASLAKTADYRAAQAAAEEAEKQLAALSADGTESAADERVTAARGALEAKEAITRMQTAALSADPATAAAKVKYTTAAESLAKLRQQYDDSLKKAPEFVSAKKALDDARAKVSAADQKLAAAQLELAREQQVHDAAVAQQPRTSGLTARAR